MKIRITLVAIALLGLFAGIVFAGPLVLSELEVKPWIHTIPGEKADFELETMFANFTIVNPESNVANMKINYQVWVNITNPSALGAYLSIADFAAAGEISAFSEHPLMGTNKTGGTGWTEEGAFVDGKWYNLTFTNDMYPFFDIDGNMQPSLFDSPDREYFWRECVQLYQRYVNGTTVAIYMNMNGTWTDVTGRIEVDEPETRPSYAIVNHIAGQFRIFQSYVPGMTGTFSGDSDVPDYVAANVEVLCGEGYFDQYWNPGESRIILIEGTQGYSQLTTFNPVDLLDSGAVICKIKTTNHADAEFWVGNNTAQDNLSDSEEQKSLELTKVNNSYIYNAGLLDGYSFSVDEWRAEVFLEAR